MKLSKTLALLAVLGFAAAGCDPHRRHAEHDHHAGHQGHQGHQGHRGHHGAGEQRDTRAEAPVARAEIKPSKAAADDANVPDVSGVVRFRQTGDQTVRVMVDLKGLPPNSTHGFHIHEKGDLSAPDLTTAGAHFNPGGGKHGGLKSDDRHAGDLGNIQSDAQGNAKMEITAHGVSIDGENSIVGRSVLVHAQADDLKTDPSGESGARIAGGVIEKPRR